MDQYVGRMDKGILIKRLGESWKYFLEQDPLSGNYSKPTVTKGVTEHLLIHHPHIPIRSEYGWNDRIPKSYV